MLYELEQSKTEELILKQVMRDKLPMPKKIAEAPQLRFGLEIYYAAFMDLTMSRSTTGFGVGSIPWHVINEYAKVYEYDEEQREDLHFYLGRMDTAFQEHMEKKNKNSAPAKKGQIGKK